jgi:hypothetical protein
MSIPSAQQVAYLVDPAITALIVGKKNPRFSAIE